MSSKKAGGKLLIGVDVLDYGRAISQGSQAAIEQASWLAHISGATLTLLYSHHKRPSNPIFEQQAIGDVADKLIKRKLQVEVVVCEDHPSDAMTDRAQAGEADMLFVGKRNRVEGAATTLGNVARKLLRTSSVPVWAVDPYHSRGLKSVLVAHDLLPMGSQSTRYAARLARMAECPMHVVHAWKRPLTRQRISGGADSPEAEEAALAQAALDAMQQDLLGVQVPADTQFHQGCGPASEVIVGAAEASKATLLVIGTRSRTGVAGLLIGNTAERVLDLARCSLLTVPPSQGATE